MTAKEIENFFLQEIRDTDGKSKNALWQLAVLYSETDRQEEAFEYVSKLAALAEASDERASCYLAMGQLYEQVEDFAGAARYYRAGLAEEAEDSPAWYWIHNNLGYCLNQLGQFGEAATYLRAAIAIASDRPNAFKNLALALQGEKKYQEAADLFVLATQVNATDARSLKHLEELVTAHPEVLLGAPDLANKLQACREAVAHARAQQPDFDAHLKALREQQKNQKPS